MPILVKLLLSRQGRKLALKALKSKALRDALKNRRVRKALANKHVWRLVYRQLARGASKRRSR